MRLPSGPGRGAVGVTKGRPRGGRGESAHKSFVHFAEEFDFIQKTMGSHEVF